MGDRICSWLWAKMPELIVWVGGLGEWQLVAAGMGGLLLSYVLYAAVYNGWLMVAGLGGRIISAPTAWDEAEAYEDWMDAEIWEGGRWN